MDTYTDPHALTPRARTCGAVRRLRGLAWMGHDLRAVAVRYGFPRDLAIDATLAGSGNVTPEFLTVAPEAWAAVAVAFDDLEMRFGDAGDWRLRALAEGWPPPLAWDPDTVDHPATRPNRTGSGAGRNTPDHAAIWRRIHGDRTVTMRNVDIVAAVTELNRQGVDDYTIADALGSKPGTVQKLRVRNGLPARGDAA